MNQLSILPPCKPNQYTIFSDAPTRNWNRSETSGRLFCCDQTENCPRSSIIQERLKYKVLRYESSNHGPGIERPRVGRISDCGAQSPFQLGNVIYRIDTPIANILNQMIKRGELTESITLTELQKIIARLREQMNLPSTDPNVLFKNIPFSYKSKYKYSTSTSKGILNGTPVFPIPYQTGILLPTTFADAIQQIVVDVYQLYFPTFLISSRNSQFIYVVRNDAMNFTGVVDDLFTSASLWGGNLLTQDSINLFVRDNVRMFDPILTYMLPASNKAFGGKYKYKFGILIDLQRFAFSNTDNINIYFTLSYPSYDSLQIDELVSGFLADIITLSQQNSRLIFIPVLKTQLDLIENVNYPSGYGVTFQSDYVEQPHKYNLLTPVSTA